MTIQLSRWSRVPLLQTSSTPVQARMRMAALGRIGGFSAPSVPTRSINQLRCVTSAKQGLSPARQFLTGLQLISSAKAAVEMQTLMARDDAKSSGTFFIGVVL